MRKNQIQEALASFFCFQIKLNNYKNMLQLITISKEDLMEDFEKIIYKVLDQLQSEKSMHDQKEYYTREETAKLLRVSVTTLYHWNKSGILNHTKIGNRVYYARSEVLSKLQVAS